MVKITLSYTVRERVSKSCRGNDSLTLRIEVDCMVNWLIKQKVTNKQPEVEPNLAGSITCWPYYQRTHNP